jgi:uncharacterized protein (DUF58 family)
MTPTPRACLLLGAIAVSALVVPLALAGAAALALAAATVVDAFAARRAPAVERDLPSVLARGVPAALRVRVRTAAPGSVRLRQAAVPDLAIAPAVGTDSLDATIVARRRGRHRLPGVATRGHGPLGLGRWDHRTSAPNEVRVLPDVVVARRLALAVRRGRLQEAGLRSRGPLGPGTEFERVRDYVPDDDIRLVNWRATARVGRPMSNEHRVDTERDVVCLVDAGRLMAAPLGDRTRLDAALDAVTAVALVADELGDRAGAIAFDAAVRARVAPGRARGSAVVEALFDLEPSTLDSDYELAFRAVARAKRAFVLVLTDLLEEAAARPLVAAVPVLARRHAVAVASTTDPELGARVATPPRAEADVLAAAVAVDVLAARRRAAALVRRAGAQVIEAAPGALPAACVDAYLRAKARLRP